MGGIDRPTSGEVLFEQQDLLQLDDEKLAELRRRRMGFVFQNFLLLPEYTASENILLPLYLDGRQADTAVLTELAGRLNIQNELNKQPHQLSGGQQQRVAIARAMIARPSVIFADEPTGNLDSENGTAVFHLLLEAAKDFGQTVVYVTHDQKMADQAGQIIRLSDGMIASGEMD